MVAEYELALTLFDKAKGAPSAQMAYSNQEETDDKVRFNVHRQLAILYSQASDSRCHSHFKNALELKPTDADLQYKYGMVLYTGHTNTLTLSTSIEVLSHALILQPNNARIAASLAVAILEADDTHSRVETNLLLYQPMIVNDYEMQLRTGVLLEHSSPEWAVFLLQSSLLRPDLVATAAYVALGFNVLGRIYCRQGEAQKALAIYWFAVGAGVWDTIERRSEYTYTGILPQQPWPRWRRLAKREALTSHLPFGGDIIPPLGKQIGEGDMDRRMGWRVVAKIVEILEQYAERIEFDAIKNGLDLVSPPEPIADVVFL
jgi:hypothetical protein